MESSPERLATICVGYCETFWMRRNARENNFAWPFFQARVFGVLRSVRPHAVKVNLSVLFLLFFQATMNA